MILRAGLMVLYQLFGVLQEETAVLEVNKATSFVQQSHFSRQVPKGALQLSALNVTADPACTGCIATSAPACS